MATRKRFFRLVLHLVTEKRTNALPEVFRTQIFAVMEAAPPPFLLHEKANQRFLKFLALG